MKKELYELIEDYLDGELPLDERASFEARVAAEKPLADELDLVKTLRRTAAEKAALEPLKKTLAEVGVDFFSLEKSSGKIVALPAPRRPKWLLPSAFAVAASLAFFFFFKNSKADLYDSSRVFPPAAFVQKGSAATDAAKSLAQAEGFFNQKNWPAAETALERATAEDPAPEPLFYLALTKMELGKTTEARAIFQKLRVEKTAFAADAAWFEALAFLKAGDQKAAAEALEKLAPSDARAARLLKKLAF